MLTYIDIFEYFSDCPFQHALQFTRSPLLPDLFRATLACFFRIPSHTFFWHQKKNKKISPLPPGPDRLQHGEAHCEAPHQPPQQQVLLHRGLGRQHPEEHRALRQAQPKVQQQGEKRIFDFDFIGRLIERFCLFPGAVHQGRDRIGRDLLLELLRAREEDHRGESFCTTFYF